MNIKELEKKTRAYALKNAISYDGTALQNSVISSLFHEGLNRSEVPKHIKKIIEIIKEINSLSLEEQKKEFEKLEKQVSEREAREGLPELPNVSKKGVVMRFRPAPSGFIHIGNIISNMSSSLYVKKYGGKFYVIIDDTNPEATIPEAYKSIKQDCDWIFGNVYKYINSSDRMEIYYKYAEKLIKKKSAYVCTCSEKQFKKFSDSKKDCPCRKLNVKENMERWKKMLDKSKNGFKEEEAVLRFKSLNGMKDKNPAMRDFPLARINLHEHPKQKKKYRVWPLMNLAVAVDDIELKMTHVIRGKDHMDNAKRQEMMFKVLGKKYPWTFFIGRIKFKDLVLSKRKMTELIEKGEYSGYDDERLPTIASLRKRGFNPKTFAKFAEHQGLNDVDKVISGEEFFKILSTFDTENKINRHLLNSG